MSRIAIPLAFRAIHPGEQSTRCRNRAAARTAGGAVEIPTTQATRDAIVLDLFNLLVQLSCVLDQQTQTIAADRRRIEVLESLAGTRAVDRETRRRQGKADAEQIRIPVELEAGL